MGLGGMHMKSTKTKRKFTLDEIYEILKTEGDLPAEPYMSGSGIMRGLFVPGIGKYDVSISTMGKKIICSEYVRQGEQMKNIGASFLTNGWSDILDKQSKDNKNITDLVGAEIERLFQNRE